MKTFIFTLILICIETTHSIHWSQSYSSVELTSIPANFSIEWYSQKVLMNDLLLVLMNENAFVIEVDHFSYANQDRFDQRYIISTDHWCDGCPIFFYTGNEGDVTAFVQNTGFMWENAKQFKAMVLFAEHRYYGKSIPYGTFNIV